MSTEVGGGAFAASFGSVPCGALAVEKDDSIFKPFPGKAYARLAQSVEHQTFKALQQS